jgi:hypothetical protein
MILPPYFLAASTSLAFCADTACARKMSTDAIRRAESFMQTFLSDEGLDSSDLYGRDLR